MIKTALLGLAVLAAGIAPSFAYPVLDAVQGLPNPELVTVYPDDADKSLYYFVPTSVALVRDEAGKPRLGVQYWGLTGPDPEGAGAALTFSVRPTYDKPIVDKVANAVKQQNPNAKFAFPTLVDSSMEILLNGAFYKKNQDTDKASVKGGTVDATQAFTVSLTNIGGRAFAQGVAADSDVLGARYTFKFTGIEKRLHARITVYQKRVYDHFKATVSGSAWYGMVKSSWSVDWQKLLSEGSIKLDILEGGETDKDNYMLDVFKILVEAKVGEKGMFEPKLKPGGIASAPEASNWGWGFSAGGGWEHLEESINFNFEINTQKLGDREFSVGLSFNAVCAKYPDNFADLTLIGKHCIDKPAMGKTAAALRQCVDAKLDRLQTLKDQGKITPAIWETQVAKAMNEVCIPEEQANNILGMPMSPTATDDATKVVATCIGARLGELKSLVDSGELTQEIWQRSVVTALNSPCRSSGTAQMNIAPNVLRLPRS
jgi:hypothetical protein